MNKLRIVFLRNSKICCNYNWLRHYSNPFDKTSPLKILRSETAAVPTDASNPFNVQNPRRANPLKSTSPAKSLSSPLNTFKFSKATLSETGVLKGRFIEYIGQSFLPPKYEGDDYSSRFPINDPDKFKRNLAQTPNKQLSNVCWYANSSKAALDVKAFSNLVHELDEEFCQRLPDLNLTHHLALLYSIIQLVPNHITQLNFYQNSMVKLATDFKAINTSVRQFVEICFYMGLLKGQAHNLEMVESMLQLHVDRYLDQMTTTDFAIVCDAAFKTSIKLQPIHQFMKRIESEVLIINESDAELLSIFIKSLRQNRYKSEKIKQKLNRLLLQSKLDHLQFRGFTHLFGYFSENLYQDRDGVVEGLKDKCMQKIETEYFQRYQTKDKSLPNDMRAKDFDTFLWCCAQLNVTSITDEQFRIIESILLDKINENEFKYEFDKLVSTCLSLWILNYKSLKILKHIFENENISVHKLQKVRIRYDSKINLLMSCIQIEKPFWFNDIDERRRSNFHSFNLNKMVPEYLLRHQPNLGQVYHLLWKLYEKDLEICRFVQPICELNIVGIKVKFANCDQSIFIEVAEESYILSDKRTPFGLLGLKIRLLKSLRYNVQFINAVNKNQEELEQCLIGSLTDYLKPSLDTTKIAEETSIAVRKSVQMKESQYKEKQDNVLRTFSAEDKNRILNNEITKLKISIKKGKT